MGNYRLNREIKKDSKWAVQRTHKVTSAVFYLSPGEKNWVSPRDHEKFGTRYGRWTWTDAEDIVDQARRRDRTFENFDYLILLHEKVK